MARLKIQLEGFDDLLKKIEKAEGDINKATDSAIRSSAYAMDNALRAEMNAENFDSPKHKIVKQMDEPEIFWSGNTCIAKVGYKLGEYDPKNLSEGFKALFFNYGTPRRAPSKEPKHLYVKKAKKKVSRQIKKNQEEVLNKILGRLK